MKKRLIVAVFVGSLGGFLFGFDLGALSAASQSLRAQFALSPWELGLTISASVWGTVCGAIFAGGLADRWGRRGLMAGCALLYAIGAIGIALPFRAEWLLVLGMRFLCGVAIGGVTVGCPLYLSEIAPKNMRGRVVGVFQVQVGAGVIAAFSVGAVCARFAPPAMAWKWVLGIGALPAFAWILLVQFLPRVTTGPDEFAVGDYSRSAEWPKQKLFVRKNARPILLATSIAVFNQLSGVNILLLYMLQIFASAGVSFSLGHTYTILISGLSLATTMLGMAFVDRWGRKPLLYLGDAGMGVCLLILGLAIPHRVAPILYLTVLVVYNSLFAFSQGTIVWIYLSELFPPGLRGAGQGFGATVHWIANAILISVFPSVQHASSGGAFYVFALMMALQILVIWLWYPETRGTELGSLAVDAEGILH